MRRSLATAAGTQLLPGTRVRFKDREAPLPPDERLKAVVVGLHLYFDGEALDLDAVGVAWDGLGPDNTPEDVFQLDECDQLEILP
jgi:hypothetical protein